MKSIAKEIYKNNYFFSLSIFTIIFIIFSILYTYDEILKSYPSYILYRLPLIAWMSVLILFIKVCNDTLEMVAQKSKEYFNSPEGKEEQKVYIKSVIKEHREKIKEYEKKLKSLEE